MALSTKNVCAFLVKGATAKGKEILPKCIIMNLKTLSFLIVLYNSSLPVGISSHRLWHSWRRNLPFGSRTSQAWWFWHRAGSGLVSQRQQALAGLPDNWEHNFLRKTMWHLFQNVVSLRFLRSKTQIEDKVGLITYECQCAAPGEVDCLYETPIWRDTLQPTTASMRTVKILQIHCQASNLQFGENLTKHLNSRLTQTNAERTRIFENIAVR